MRSRERILIILTVVVAVVGAFFHFFYEDVETALISAEGGGLAAEQEMFRRNFRTIDKGEKIRTEYENLTLRNVPESRGNQRKENVFMDELARLLTQEFRQPNPNVGSAQMSPIPKVEDYYFVDVEVALGGNVEDLMRLLIQMEQRGLLIKDFTLTQGATARRRVGALKVEVSRLVQHDAISRNQMRMLRRFGN